MLAFAYFFTRNLKNLFDLNGMGNCLSSFPLPGSSTTNIHQIVESVSNSIGKVEHADHNLYRQ